MCKCVTHGRINAYKIGSNIKANLFLLEKEGKQGKFGFLFKLELKDSTDERMKNFYVIFSYLCQRSQSLN